MGDMLNLEAGRAYMIKYAEHAELNEFLIISKKVHYNRCHSYYGISTLPGNLPCDSALYLWDRGVANTNNRRRLSSMGSAIQMCRPLTKDERAKFEKELKGKYKFK